MLENPIFLLSLSIIFAAIPVAVWLYIFFQKSEKSKKTVALIFCLGCLTAPILLGIQYLWEIFPKFNLAAFIESSFEAQNTMFIFTFILFGAMEEIIKLYVIRTVDKRTLLINNVNDAVRYSITSALGFSFVENIYYLYQFWPSISLGELIGMYIFRSIFTACAHMIFSGIFGYYYGIGKFSIVIAEESKITKEKDLSSKIIARLFKLPLSEGFRQKMVVQGLFLAIFLHAAFNYMLQFNIMIPVLAFAVIGFLYLQYLLKRKAGHLILLTDPSEKRQATIAKKDEDVVIELLGMWFKEKRYVDVIHICERLLERDPDNRVIQLFKANAMDKIDKNNTYKKILGTIIKSKKDLSENEKNIITKYTEQKEKMQKMPAQTNQKSLTIKNKNKNYVDEYTKGNFFKL